jgi:hypothetical protein
MPTGRMAHEAAHTVQQAGAAALATGDLDGDSTPDAAASAERSNLNLSKSNVDESAMREVPPATAVPPARPSPGPAEPSPGPATPGGGP